jgi:hypothetical protein
MANQTETRSAASILDLVASLTKDYENKCRVGRWFDTLDVEERTALESLLAKPRANRTEVYERLCDITTLPFKITLFKDHLKGSCSCPKR